MKQRMIMLTLCLFCLGISQLEEVPMKKALEEQSVNDVGLQGENLLRGNAGITPETVELEGGRLAWKVTIPGNRPLATVAYEDGMIFLGGGYGSYEFYALDARTGEVKWVYQTGDDGPTAAVVKKGYVIFNTESCIIYVLKAKTGEKVWEKWLGDPLMSQPAFDGEKVYIAYPAGDGHHHLACMKVEDGAEIWDVPIAGDLISAPILSDSSVYITCFDGTVCRYHGRKGKLLWSQQKNATCAPAVVDERVFLTMRETQAVQGDSFVQYEGVATLQNADGRQEQSQLWARREAPYLVYNRSTAKTAAQAELDASVGFGSAPGSAKIEQAQGNVGQSTVVGCWAYQGSRPVVVDARFYNAMGNEIQALDIDNGGKVWTKTYDLAEEGLGGRYLSPPSYANGKLFLGSGGGDVYCISARDGKLLWKTAVGASISFQPTVANGMVYISCDNGTLYGISTGEPADDGWYMWGGNAEHNQ